MMKAYYVTCMYEEERCFLCRSVLKREWFAGSRSNPVLMYKEEAYAFEKMQENSERFKEFLLDWQEQGYTDFKVHEIELELE